MFRHPDGVFRVDYPARIVFDGVKRKFNDLTAEQLDVVGYNEAMPIERERFTTYATQWVKGDDLILREVIVSAVVDEEAKAEDAAQAVRADRDVRLMETDWTQLVDCPLDEADILLWQAYRQALRDVPQQAGFPYAVEWPVEPE